MNKLIRNKKTIVFLVLVAILFFYFAFFVISKDVLIKPRNYFRGVGIIVDIDAEHLILKIKDKYKSGSEHLVQVRFDDKTNIVNSLPVTEAGIIVFEEVFQKTISDLHIGTPVTIGFLDKNGSFYTDFIEILNEIEDNTIYKNIQLSDGSVREYVFTPPHANLKNLYHSLLHCTERHLVRKKILSHS